MKAFLAALVVLVAITVGADFALREAGWSSAQRSSGPSVRLGD